MTALTSTGFTRSRLDERLAQLKEAMRAIFGEEINLDPDTIDGQTLGIYAESISNLDQLAEDTYQGGRPSSASGVHLSRIVQYNGIRRKGGTYSIVPVRCGGTAGTLILANSLVTDPSGTTVFKTLEDATIGGGGTVDVDCQAATKGAVVAAAGTLTKIGTPTYGWQTVTNPTDAIPGTDEETDEALRQRRAASTATPSQAVIDAIHGAILNITDVTQARVFENDQDEVDGDGLPPHSIYCVVEGGADADIAQAIWIRKTAGTTMVGDESVVAYDSQGGPHTVKFSRPQDVNVYVTVNLTTRTGWPTDGLQRIKDALVAWGLAEQQIGEELIHSRLYSPVNTVPGFSIDSLYIGTSPTPSGTSNITVPFDGLARLDSSRITVNVTTP